MDSNIASLIQTLMSTILGPVTVAMVGFLIWRLQQTNKRVEEAAVVSQEVKREVKNSHPVSLRTDLDTKFENLYERMDQRDAEVDARTDAMEHRLEHIEDNQTVHELQMRAVTNVMSVVKTALDKGFKTDS